MADRHPASISDELKALIEGPVSVLVGTRDSRLVPEITRAWGPKVSEAQRITLCVPLATSRKTLDNLEANGQISPDGTPNMTYLSVVHRIDSHHVGLSYQFFNKTRENM